MPCIHIRQKNGNEHDLMFDECDRWLIEGAHWYASRSGKVFYAKRTAWRGGIKSSECLHRAILTPPDGMVIDHIDHNGLNNCRNNLRVVTRHQNLLNKSRYVTSKSVSGVTWRKATRKWIARANVNYVRVYLGSYDTEAEAIAARAKSESEHYLMAPGYGALANA